MLWIEWRSTNTGWHINVHHVKYFWTHMKCEVKHNGDMGMGCLWLKMGGALWLKWVGQLWQSKMLFRLETCSKIAGLHVTR